MRITRWQIHIISDPLTSASYISQKQRNTRLSPKYGWVAQLTLGFGQGFRIAKWPMSQICNKSISRPLHLFQSTPNVCSCLETLKQRIRKEGNCLQKKECCLLLCLLFSLQWALSFIAYTLAVHSDQSSHVKVVANRRIDTPSIPLHRARVLGILGPCDFLSRWFTANNREVWHDTICRFRHIPWERTRLPRVPFAGWSSQCMHKAPCPRPQMCAGF